MIACRVLGGLFCAFYNGRDARCASCGRDARHPDKGRDDWWASFAAKMAAFPVGGGSPHRVKRRERRFPEGAASPATGKMPIVPVGGRGATALPVEADVLCAVRHIFA